MKPIGCCSSVSRRDAEAAGGLWGSRRKGPEEGRDVRTRISIRGLRRRPRGDHSQHSGYGTAGSSAETTPLCPEEAPVPSETVTRYFFQRLNTDSGGGSRTDRSSERYPHIKQLPIIQVCCHYNNDRTPHLVVCHTLDLMSVAQMWSQDPVNL